MQGAAGALLLQWHKIGERGRRWATHREVTRGVASVVLLHAWMPVCTSDSGDSGGEVAGRGGNVGKRRMAQMS